MATSIRAATQLQSAPESPQLGRLETNSRISKALSVSFSEAVTSAKILQAAHCSDAARGQRPLFVPQNDLVTAAGFVEPINAVLFKHAPIDVDPTGTSNAC